MATTKVASGVWRYKGPAENSNYWVGTAYRLTIERVGDAITITSPYLSGYSEEWVFLKNWEKV